MISRIAKPTLLALIILASSVSYADCDGLKSKKIRLSNGSTLLHSGGDLFRAEGLESDTYSLQLNQRKYVLMRVNYEHFKCFD